MSSLHQTLADLARDHGTELFRDASAFRGSLDDYLDEGQASSGTINLLTDAVRLGALDGMLSMLSSGASAGSAVESAGQRLARDRGSADIRGCQWAVAVLGFALGRIPEELVVGLAPGSGTTPGSMPAAPPPPPSAAPPAPAATPAPPSYPVYAPAPSAGQPTGPSSHPAPTWQQPAPHKSRAGLLIGAIAVGLVMLVVVIIGIVVVLRSGGDNSPPAADPTSSAPSDDSSDEPTGDPTDEPTTETEVPDIGGPTFSGTGYVGQLPEGWTDATDAFTADNPDISTTDKVFVWGDSFQTARANVIIEVQSAFGSTDPNDLKDTWIQALTGDNIDVDYQDIDSVSIGGEDAIGIDVSRTNDAGRAISQRAYLVIHEDKAYALGASMVVGDDDVLTALSDILSTWQWD